MTAKIAVIGSVNGQLTAVFAKLATLHAKNNFSFAVVAGSLFGDAAAQDQHADEVKKLLAGQIEVPLTTYFTLGHHELPAAVVARLMADEELCPNFSFLGRRTTFKTAEGIRIVALGGAHQAATADALGDYSPVYTDVDAKVLRGASTADLLFTSDWPKNVSAGSNVQIAQAGGFTEQQAVSDLCSRIKPRYHFSVSDGFYEREPFYHRREEDTAGYQTTRFLSLAPYGNAHKQKWIYAFSLDTSAPLPTALPAGTTVSPLSATETNKRKAAEPSSFRFSSSGSDGHSRRHKKSRGPPLPDECFFCLSSPNAATHLITSIGDSAYMTTAKGPLTTSTTFSDLSVPGHMLIIPLSHSPCPSAVEADSRTDTLQEMHRFRLATQRMLGSKGLGSVAWQIDRAGGVHFHQQIIPVERDFVTKGLAAAGFKVAAENEGWPRFEEATIAPPEDGKGEWEDKQGGDVLQVWISACEEGQAETRLILRLDDSFRFDLQFPRRVVAQLCGWEGRMDWRNCGQTVDEETRDAEAWKGVFDKWDFTNE